MASDDATPGPAPSVQPAVPKPPKNNPAPPPSAEQTADAYEATHVHTVYEAIASHFSHTRHKPWPRVSSFLDSLPVGALGLDVGCGNGKYLRVNHGLFVLGSDRSANLVALARENDGSAAVQPPKAPQPAPKRKGKTAKASQDNQVDSAPEPPKSVTPTTPVQNEVIVADSLSLPYRLASADFAISIAVLHHLSTPERRRLGVRAILDCLRPGGKALLFVWALEQGSSRRGWDEGAPQDQLVPWVTKAQPPPKASKPEGQDQAANAEGGEKDATWHRYYHLYKEGELDDDIRAVGGEVLESGYERDNWWAICARTAVDVVVPPA